MKTKLGGTQFMTIVLYSVMLTVTELYTYPVKSLGGISLKEADLCERGIKYDRRWMVVDTNNKYLSQRDLIEMALLRVRIEEPYLIIEHSSRNAAPLRVPIQPVTDDTFPVTIFDDVCNAIRVSDEADAWFTDALSFRCKLVFMPGETRRRVDKDYSRNNEITGFTDGFPFLLLGQESLDDLNRRLKNELPMNRFRPNIVFKGGNPYEEDQMSHFGINGISFYGVKRCARCVITTIDQEKAVKGKDPLRTLSTYRAEHNNVYFGQYLVHEGKGKIKVGEELTRIEN